MTQDRLNQIRDIIENVYEWDDWPLEIVKDLVNEVDRLTNLRTQDIENLQRTQKELRELKLRYNIVSGNGWTTND